MLFPLTNKELKMTGLTSLKLVTSKKHQTVSPIVHRRNKLIAKVHQQLELCEAQQAGNIYAPKRLKTYVNKQTGERMTTEVVKRVKEWFWISDNGRINLAVKYGAKTLPLNKKGANAIELVNGDELIATLKSLKQLIANGELDDAITEVSTATRASFNK
ncbi:DUF6641 family protein [Polynucleobacter sp. QLW-P1DATA-2]|uniref:DUF6641 family protein n=1 Tax=Polynucleobacter sp. QLW-P1DATA-2 TaxID=1743167 RepID=UPI003512F6B9